ncbi:MAG: hypothetical protein F6K10_36525 [Moorea sp. SIO2B7]|nr:hypothetical protein [Moorena sp. SIO2B7]
MKSKLEQIIANLKILESSMILDGQVNKSTQRKYELVKSQHLSEVQRNWHKIDFKPTLPMVIFVKESTWS